MACMAEEKETQRRKVLKGAYDDDTHKTQFQEHGVVILGEASKAILMKWYSTARENVFGVNGRSRGRVPIEDISDDEEEDSQHKWANGLVEFSDRTAFIATYWLRSARAKVQNEKTMKRRRKFKL